MALSDRLNTTVVVKRNTATADTIGGFTLSLATSIASLDCRISMKGSTERNLGDKVDSAGNYNIFVLRTTATLGIKIHDVFVDGSDSYEILNINRPSREAHIEFDAEIIATEA